MFAVNETTFILRKWLVVSYHNFAMFHDAIPYRNGKKCLPN